MMKQPPQDGGHRSRRRPSRETGAANAWAQGEASEQPETLREKDRELKENPVKTVPNRYVRKIPTGTVDPEQDFTAESGDHFRVTWQGPHLPPTATVDRRRSRTAEPSDECPAPQGT